MTNQEKIDLLHSLNERQLAVSAIISSSDAHASECTKLGFVFSEKFPKEYAEYSDALTEYRENKRKIAEIEAIIPEDEPRDV